MGYIYVILTILFTTYGQLVLKWRMINKPDIPIGFRDKIKFMFTLYSDLWILSAFFASISWMLAVKNFELSKVYPFMGLNFILVMFLSYSFLGEQINLNKIGGVFLIILGLIFISKK